MPVEIVAPPADYPPDTLLGRVPVVLISCDALGLPPATKLAVIYAQRGVPCAHGRAIRHRTIHHRPWRTLWPSPTPPPPASFPNSLARRMAFGAGPILRPGRPLPLPVPATELICVAFRWCPSSSSIHHDPADFSRVPSDHDSNVGTPERGFRPHLIRL